MRPNDEKIKNKKRVAWGITGSGDKLSETIEVMKTVRSQFHDVVDIRVYLSKAGHQVLKFYKLFHNLEDNFDKISVEINSNSPFLAGALQLGRFDFLLIAPSTSNTVAKISLSIADSLLSNAAIMALKSFVPVYILPSDYKEGELITKLPDGRDYNLRIRKEDVYHVKNLATVEGVSIIEKPKEILQIFAKHFL